MARNIPNQCKLTAFQAVRVPKVKDIFRRMGYRRTSQSDSGQVADFSRNPLESFDGENRRMSQHYYDKYVEMMQKEEAQKEEAQKVEAQKEKKSDDNQTVEDEKV